MRVTQYALSATAFRVLRIVISIHLGTLKRFLRGVGFSFFIKVEQIFICSKKTRKFSDHVQSGILSALKQGSGRK